VLAALSAGVTMSQETFITQVLEHWGLTVTKIPEQQEKTPDFLAVAGESSYLIELKTKSPNPDILNQREAALNTGELFEEHIPMLPRNRFSGVIRSATDQLASYNADDAIQLIWVHCEGHSAKTQMDQFEITLYGSTSLVDFSENGTMGDCYFFSNSDFYRYKHILDGAILSTPEEAKICLNPLSENYEKFQESFLCTSLHEGICDPYAREKEGVAYIVDGAVDRTDKNSVLSFLRNKYGQDKLMDMTMNHMSATVAVPHRE
jgi:hypothetical protein